MKKQNKQLLILIALLILIVLGVGGYFIYNKLADKNSNKYETLGYSIYDFSKQEDFKTTSIIDDSPVSEFALFETIDLKIKLNSKTKEAYFTYKDKSYNINIDNIKNIYAYEVGCEEGASIVYLLTEKGNIYYLDVRTWPTVYEYTNSLDEIADKVISKGKDNFKKLNLKNTYNKLAIVKYDIGTTCGMYYKILGYDVNNKLYVLDTEKAFSDECSYYIGMDAYYCVDFNGNVYKYNDWIKNDKLNINVKKVIDLSYIDAIILDKNDMLYYYGEETYEIRKINETKVTKILYKVTDSQTDYVFFFENGDKKEMSIANK